MDDTERADAAIVWSRVEDGFHVGSRHGDFLGYIDRQPDGGFIAFDSRSRRVGRFDALTEAMATLSQDQAPEDAVITLDHVPGKGTR